FRIDLEDITDKCYGFQVEIHEKLRFLLENRGEIVFVKFKKGRRPVSRLQGFPMLFSPVEIVLYTYVPVFLMFPRFTVLYRYGKQLFSSRAVNIHTVAVGLFLKVILCFEDYPVVYQGNHVHDRGEIGRMYEYLLF